MHNLLINVYMYFRACFKKLPRILCFNTMRYTFNMVTMMKEKVNTHFSFPLCLDMSQYMEKNLMGPDKLRGEAMNRWLEFNLFISQKYILCINLLLLVYQSLTCISHASCKYKANIWSEEVHLFRHAIL